MLEDFSGLHMQLRVVATHQGQDLGFLEENVMIGVTEHMQTSPAASGDNSGCVHQHMNAVLCSTSVHLTK